MKFPERVTITDNVGSSWEEDFKWWKPWHWLSWWIFR